MNAHAQVNKLSAIVHRLPTARWVGEWIISHGVRFEVVDTPTGPVWRTTVALDFPRKKTAR